MTKSNDQPEIQMHWWGRGLQHVSGLLIKRGTVMAPFLPLLFIAPIFAGLACFSSVMPLVFGGVAVACVLAYLLAAICFALIDPDRLQSEEHRYQMYKLQHTIAAKELPHPVSADVFDLQEPTSNPELPPPTVPLEENTDVQESTK